MYILQLQSRCVTLSVPQGACTEPHPAIDVCLLKLLTCDVRPFCCTVSCAHGGVWQHGAAVAALAAPVALARTVCCCASCSLWLCMYHTACNFMMVHSQRPLCMLLVCPIRLAVCAHMCVFLVSQV
jgi:hypothetical protein